MTRPVSHRVRAAKFILFAIGVAFNLLLISFPILIPAQIQDRILLSFILSVGLVTLFAFEEIRLVIQEQHEETRDKLARVDAYLLCLSLYRSLRNIEDTNDTMFYELTKTMLTQLEKRLKEAEVGRLPLDSVADTSKLALDLATHIEKSLDATVLWDSSLQDRPEKEEYLRRLAFSISDHRKAVVRRLFLIKRGVEKESEFRLRVQKDQHELVQVKYLHLENWANMQGINSPMDFGIWDHRRVWVYTSDPAHAPGQQFACILNDRASIQLYKNVFEANWDRGKHP